MADSSDAFRRWLGLMCLTLAAGMLIWGQTVLKPHLDGLGFLVYWGICFLLTFGAIFIALIDIIVMRRRTRREQRELLERTLEQVDDNRKEDPDKPGE